MHFVYIFLLLLVSTTCLAETLEEKVVRVVNRDALVVLVSGNLPESTHRNGGSLLARKPKRILSELQVVSLIVLNSIRTIDGTGS